MRSLVVLALVASVLLVLTACNALSPGQQDAVGAVLGDMLRDGRLTQQQYEALLAALQTGNWQHVTDTAIEVGASVVLALLGVRAWRGPINARRGVAPGIEIIGQPVGAPVGGNANG